MLNRFIKIILFSLFFLPIISQAPSFAWHDYTYYGDWDYYGSGRDHPYSSYIDRYYYVGYADYAPIVPDDIELAPLPVHQIPPIPAVPPALAPQNEFTVNIPNKLGGYTAVVIKRKGDGFTGPQGEYYPEFPKVFQLEIMYGK